MMQFKFFSVAAALMLRCLVIGFTDFWADECFCCSSCSISSPNQMAINPKMEADKGSFQARRLISLQKYHHSI
jgi:hypothetical protein